MTGNRIQLPGYARFSLIMLGLVLTGLVLYLGKEIAIPLTFAMLIAILLLRMCRFLERHRVPRPVAIIICIIIAFAAAGSVIYFISFQVAQFGDDMPRLQERMAHNLDLLRQWIQNTFHVSAQKQTAWANEKLQALYKESGKYITSTLSTLTGIAVFIGLMPVYIFLFLYYRQLLVTFIVRAFAEEDRQRIRAVLHETRTVIQSYIVGLLVEALIVAVLNSVGLLIVGLDYAVLIGVIAAILNIVPYIGGLVAIILAVAMALISKDSLLYPLLVTGVLLLVQFIDNNILVPRVVASKVSLNALVSIVVVLIGGAMAGIGGMFLSIPITAILKVVFDRTDTLKPWGMLLGDKIPGEEERRLNS